MLGIIVGLCRGAALAQDASSAMQSESQQDQSSNSPSAQEDMQMPGMNMVFHDPIGFVSIGIGHAAGFIAVPDESCIRNMPAAFMCVPLMPGICMSSWALGEFELWSCCDSDCIAELAS
jgi:hypothetical protein